MARGPMKSDRPDGRLNLALVLASLHTGSSQPLWPAVADAAARADSNLFVFPGGRIGLREGYEASRNAIYNLAAGAPLDGVLVWTSSISGAGGPLGSGEFLERFRGLPAVSLSGGVAGPPVVTIDYYQGMRDAVRHAALDHGYPSIAFLRGPEGHPGAEERYRAYLDVLKEAQGGADLRLVSSPLPWDAGREALLELLDERRLLPGRDFRALVAASDLMALYAVKLLKERSFRIPEDVAVFGMNNTAESRLASPPLTTADGPFAELGAMSVATILDSIAGKKVPSLTMLRSRLVVRGSCGCPSESFLLAAAEARTPPEAEPEAEPEAAKPGSTTAEAAAPWAMPSTGPGAAGPAAVAAKVALGAAEPGSATAEAAAPWAMPSTGPGAAGPAAVAAKVAPGATEPKGLEELIQSVARVTGASPEIGRDWIGPLAQAWVTACHAVTLPATAESRPYGTAGAAGISDTDSAAGGVGAGGAARFLDLLERVADRIARGGLEFGPWQCAISLFRRHSLALLGPCERGSMEDLAGRARIILAEGVERAQVYRAWEEDRRADELRALDHELLVAYDLRRLSRVLLEGLPPLGIASAYVCRYEGSGGARLVLGFRDGEELSGEGPAFPAADLLPRELFPGRRLGYIVEPLYFHDSALGYALFEIGPRRGGLYEELRNSVSNALRGAVLFARLEEARERAEKADEIKSLLLSNVSHELRAPAVLVAESSIRLLAADGSGSGLSEGQRAELLRIKASAEHQLRLVNDLLDLSRAEIDELDIERVPTDVGPLLRSLFEDYASGATPAVAWELCLPERLPLVLVDPGRFRQICSNLLDNARKFTASGRVRLEAEAAPPRLFVRVRDSGPGIPASRMARIFEPFISARPPRSEGEPEEGRRRGGAGLGLSIARHLAALHFGTLEAESEAGAGSTFTLDLPLPNLEGIAQPRAGAVAPIGNSAGSTAKAATGVSASPARGASVSTETEAAAVEKATAGATTGCILVISDGTARDPALEAVATRAGMTLRRITLEEAESGVLSVIEPAAIAWDMEEAGPAEWSVFRKIRQSPRLLALPFLLYGRAPTGTVSLLGKGGGLADALMLACPPGGDEPVLVADDDPEALEGMRRAIRKALPGVAIVTARDGAEAWELARERPPRIAVLDLAMPGLSGFEVLERLRADDRLYAVPVIVVTNKVITAEDVKRIERHARVLVQNKGIWSEQETGERISRLLYDGEALPAPTSAVVKRAVAYLNEGYRGSIARWKLAEAVNVSEDYLSRIFRRELGLTPWEYLTRLRVRKAKELLKRDSAGVAGVAESVGFSDQAYFCRVFKKATGMSPQAFRSSSSQ